jgi:hypothetical protein
MMSGVRAVFWLSIFLVVSASGALEAGELFVELNTGYFVPSEQVFRDIYGEDLQLGVEMSMGLKRLEVWLGASRFAADGELTFTGEPTSLEILPVEVGVRYRFRGKAATPYVGVAAGVFFFSESSPLGDIDSSEPSFSGEVGAFIRLMRRTSLDLRIDRSWCKTDPGGFDVEIGGTAAYVGVRYQL